MVSSREWLLCSAGIKHWDLKLLRKRKFLKVRFAGVREMADDELPLLT